MMSRQNMLEIVRSELTAACVEMAAAMNGEEELSKEILYLTEKIDVLREVVALLKRLPEPEI